ncbi:MAG: 2-amino-4-hydroxy-6-hydroxymethyldihydropteridine diphosphokinase [Candidatus Omnitrophota bacterium]
MRGSRRNSSVNILRMMVIVYLGIGSNIGDREKNFEEALSRLKKIDGVEALEASSTYYTKPVGGPVQDDYLNGVLKIETIIPPVELLDILKSIEKDMGRSSSDKDYPRVIDLDILLYGEERIESEKLIVPHPKMHERQFVLKGLAEIAPEAVHAGTGKTIGELYRETRKN